MGQIEQALQARRRELFFYSPYNFIRQFDAAKQFELCVAEPIRHFESADSNNRVIDISVEDSVYSFFVSFLPWDTNYFGIKTSKLSYVLYTDGDFTRLCKAAEQFRDILKAEQTYCFIEIPSEDIYLIQALNSAGFRLVETRLTYYRGALNDIEFERYPVRKANTEDTDNLMRVAKEMRNDYDRFHADVIFGTQLADDFLSVYIQQSLKGYADVVLTPSGDNAPDSFLTARYQKDKWNEYEVAISKMVLSAVSAKTNKGWYRKLITEMTYHLREEGASYIFMNTQSANRAVIHTWEELGYKLGCTTHILSYS